MARSSNYWLWCGMLLLAIIAGLAVHITLCYRVAVNKLEERVAVLEGRANTYHAALATIAELQGKVVDNLEAEMKRVNRLEKAAEVRDNTQK